MAEKKTTAKAAEEIKAVVEEVKEAAAVKEEAPKKAATKKTTRKTTTKKTAAKKDTEKTEKAPAKKTTRTRKTTAKKAAAKAEEVKAVEAPAAEEVKAVEAPAVEKVKAVEAPAVEEVKAVEAPAVEEVKVEEAPAAEEVKAEEPAAEEAPAEPDLPQPRRSIAFIGSECYPFVKTGGLGDVMYALPKALIAQNCDVKVILPRYKCIPQKWQEKMVYRGAFHMDLCADGRTYYVGIMEYVWDGVVYDFIDNEEFFSEGKPYTNLIDDIPKFCYFGKAALAALNYMDWIPDVIHCHDWQAGLVPVYLRTMFADTPVARVLVRTSGLCIQ